MNPDTLCPKCGSATDYLVNRKKFLCSNEDCSHTFSEHTNHEVLDIFLSYGHDDKKEIALRLKEVLEKKGHQVWFDIEKIKGGVDWEAYIDEGINRVAESNAGRFILLMTEYSVRRPDGYCLNELTRALSKNVRVYPVMVEMVEPPLSICRLQWIDFTNTWSGRSITAMFDNAISELLNCLQYNQYPSDGSIYRLESILKPVSFDSEINQFLDNFVGRKWMLDKVNNWLESDNNEKILWITGPSGSGKSALSAKLQVSNPYIKAFFQCQAPKSENQGIFEPSDPRWCIRTIVYYLAVLMPQYSEKLLRSNLEDLASENKSAESMFRNLISNMLLGINPNDMYNHKYVSILIDGIDELTTSDGRNELAEFLSSKIQTTEWLKFILVSRHERPLTTYFDGFTRFDLRDNTDMIEGTPANLKDLREYIVKNFTKFKHGEPLYEEEIQTLLDKSEMNFLYLREILKELDEKELTFDDLNDFPNGLKLKYINELKRRIPDINEFNRKWYDTLAIILCSELPINTNDQSELENVLGWDRAYYLKEFESVFGSMFYFSDNKIRPTHRFLFDWWFNNGRYTIKKCDGHIILAKKGWEYYKSFKVNEALEENRLLREFPYHVLTFCETTKSYKYLDQLEEFLLDIRVFALLYGNDWNRYSLICDQLCILYEGSKDQKINYFIQHLYDNLEIIPDIGIPEEKVVQGYYALASISYEANEFDICLDISTKLIDRLPDTPTERRSDVCTQIGDVYMRLINTNLNYITEMEKYYKVALDDRVSLNKGNPNSEYAICINNFGHVFLFKGMYEIALKQYEAALEMYLKLDKNQRSGIADTYNNIAICHNSLGNTESRRESYEKCLEILENPKYIQRDFEVIFGNVISFYRSQGEFQKAAEISKQLYYYLKKLYGLTHEKTIDYLKNRILDLTDENSDKDFEEVFNEIISIGESAYGKNTGKFAVFLSKIGYELIINKKERYGLIFLSRANECINNSSRLNSNDILEGLIYQSYAYAKMKDYNAFISMIEKIINDKLYIIEIQKNNSLSNALLDIIIDMSGGRSIIILDEYLEILVEHILSPLLVAECVSFYSKAIEIGHKLRSGTKLSLAFKIYEKVINSYNELNESDSNKNDDNVLFNTAIAYNELSFHKYLPEKQWDLGIQYQKSVLSLIKNCNTVSEKELVNMKLNYERALWMSGQVPDIQKVKEFTEVLSRYNDQRAEKGKAILAISMN